MKPFSNHRTRRRTTFLALIVWLFALASGMANACRLEMPGKHEHAVVQHASEAVHVHADDILLDHSAAADDHEHGTNGPKESCLKACDDGANASVKLQFGLDVIDPGLAVLVGLAWNSTAPVAATPCPFEDLQIPAIGPPLRLRYARLTL